MRWPGSGSAQVTSPPSWSRISTSTTQAGSATSQRCSRRPRSWCISGARGTSPTRAGSWPARGWSTATRSTGFSACSFPFPPDASWRSTISEPSTSAVAGAWTATTPPATPSTTSASSTPTPATCTSATRRGCTSRKRGTSGPRRRHPTLTWPPRSPRCASSPRCSPHGCCSATTDPSPESVRRWTVRRRRSRSGWRKHARRTRRAWTSTTPSPWCGNAPRPLPGAQPRHRSRHRGEVRPGQRRGVQRRRHHGLAR